MNQPSPTYDPRNPLYLQAFAALPNTPPDLSVLINTVNNGFWTTGLGHMVGNGFTQVGPLVPPGANSYWAVVYYDQVNQAFGVTYSTASTNPVIQLPDYLSQVPVCAVLLSSTTTAVTAAMIVDLTGNAAYPTVASLPSGSFSVNTNFDTKGASVFNLSCTVTAALNLNFLNVRSGAFFWIVYFNSTAGALNIGLNMTSPGGVSWSFTGQLTTSAANAPNPNSAAATTTYTIMGFVTGTSFRIFLN